MFRKICLSLCLVVVLVFPAIAEVKTYTDPYVMVNEVAEKTFARLAREKDQILANPERLRTIVDEELVPYIDVRYAAFRVIGNYISTTTEEERNAFVVAFKDYMIATYVGAFTQYRDQEVVIDPSRDIGNQSLISIRTRVIEQGKPDINIEFKLRKPRNSDNWQVFDMVAEGISLLDSKRAELGGLIRQRGLPHVTAMLVERAQGPIVLKE